MTHTRTIPYPYHGATHVPGLVPPPAMGQNEGEVALSHIQHHSFSGDRPPVPVNAASGYTKKQRCRAEKRSQRSRCANFRSFMVFPP